MARERMLDEAGALESTNPSPQENADLGDLKRIQEKESRAIGTSTFHRSQSADDECGIDSRERFRANFGTAAIESS
jgi:hypothetical protein